MRKTDMRHRVVVIRGTAASGPRTGPRRAVRQPPAVRRLVVIKNGEFVSGIAAGGAGRRAGTSTPFHPR
jgi:hypothetical protein